MRLGMFMHPIHDFKRGYHKLLMEDMEVIRARRQRLRRGVAGRAFFPAHRALRRPLMIFARLAADAHASPSVPG